MTTDPKEDLKRRFAEARKLQEAGKDEEALSAFGKIIGTNPKLAEAHFQVARLFIKNDRPDRAINHATMATMLRPRVPDVWKLRSDVVRTLSDPEESRRFQEQIDRVKDLDGRFRAELKTGVDLPQKVRPDLRGMRPDRLMVAADHLVKGQWKEAEKVARSAIAMHPEVGALHDALAVALAGQKRNAEADQSFKMAIQFDRNFADAHAHYARLLTTLEKYDLAMRHVNAALRLAPGQPGTLVVRGMILKALGRNDLAAQDYKRAISIDPKYLDASYALCSILNDDKDYVTLHDLVMPIVERPNTEARFLVMAANANIELGDPEKALELLKRAKGASQDERAIIALRIAETEQSLGHFEAADKAFAESIDCNPRRGETYRVFLTSKKIAIDDPMVLKMQSLWEDETVPDVSRANFGFALGKVMEDNEAYDRVFEYLHPANAILHRVYPDDENRRTELKKKQQASFDSIDWSNVQLESKCEFAPIFVTGMPRSGTTLVEQIISSHSKVSGAGEAAFAVRNALKLIGREEEAFRPLASIPVSELEDLAKDYEVYLRRLGGSSEFITDKSIQAFDYVGMLKLAMPKARFVIVRRDPRDNLLSIYKNIFPSGGHSYSYDLKACVHYYRAFVDSVNFWRERTPDWFYEIQYEDLVANPEEETRKLIDAVGLDWEDQCLEFHKNDRRVRTLSVYQVRQPMYKSSTKAWERYRDDLKELFDALGPEYMDAAE